jgi:hypothetical protein
MDDNMETKMKGGCSPNLGSEPLIVKTTAAPLRSPPRAEVAVCKPITDPVVVNSAVQDLEFPIANWFKWGCGYD